MMKLVYEFSEELSARIRAASEYSGETADDLIHDGVLNKCVETMQRAIMAQCEDYGESLL